MTTTTTEPITQGTTSDRVRTLSDAAAAVVRAAEVVRVDDTGDVDLLARLKDRVRALSGMMWDIQRQDPKPPAPAGWDDLEAALWGLPPIVLAIEHCIEHPGAQPLGDAHSEGWRWSESFAVDLAHSVVTWAEKHTETPTDEPPKPILIVDAEMAEHARNLMSRLPAWDEVDELYGRICQLAGWIDDVAKGGVAHP